MSIRVPRNVLGGIESIKVGAVAPTAPVTGTLWVDTGGTGISAQPLNADLTAIAALTPTNDDLIQRKSGVWVNRTPAQYKVDLALVKGDVGLGSVDNTADASKPVSTAQATAIAAKQATIVGSSTPYLLTLGLAALDTIATTLTLAAAGGTTLVPVLVPAPIFLQSVSIRSLDTATARSWEWRLFLDVGSGTLNEVAGLNGSESFTPAAASIRTVAATTPALLAPGLYWAAIRDSHATSTFALASAAPLATTASMALDVGQTKTIASSLTTTLDATTGWAKLTATLPAVRLNGRAFGVAAAF